RLTKMKMTITFSYKSSAHNGPEAELMLQVRCVHKTYGSNQVLRGVDLFVQKGEGVCLLGPSGSGKTTLLRTLNHLDTTDAGQILVNGLLIGYRQVGDKFYELSQREVCRRGAGMGVDFQHVHQFPHMTVLQKIIEVPV